MSKYNIIRVASNNTTQYKGKNNKENAKRRVDKKRNNFLNNDQLDIRIYLRILC